MYDFDRIVERRHTNSVKYDGQYAHLETIPMWVADMDFETLPEVKEALLKRAQHGIFGYAGISDEHYQSVIDWMKRRHHFHIQKEWIVTTPGVVTALKLAVRCLTDVNDKVMILKPVYYPFDMSIELNQREIVECPLIYQNGEYNCDFELFEKTIVEHQVKMFILCNPHNPIGKVWSYDELKTIGDICLKHHVYIVSDEIHMDFVYKGYTHIPLYNVDERLKDIAIICTAPSKTFNLAALQISHIMIANDNIRKAFLKEKQASGVNDPNIFGLDACQAAYTYGDQWVDELVDYLAGNAQLVDEFIKKRLPKLHLIKPQGLYLLWIDARDLGLDIKELEAFMLEKAHLWLDEGYIFGTGGEGFERMNIACPRSIVQRALEQLEEAIKKFK